MSAAVSPWSTERRLFYALKPMIVSLNAPPTNTGGPADAPDDRHYYSISEAAALLGVSRVSIWRWIRSGRLPAARLGL